MKRVVCFWVLLVMLMSLYVPAHAAISNEQIQDLKSLGVMVGDENGNMRLGDPITRAELTKMLCVAGKIDVTKEVNCEQFPDVSELHWAYKYILAIKEYDIINGDPKGLFHPDNNVTYEEAIKMIVSLLGYEAWSLERGGYPAGYMMSASDLGIIENVQIYNGQSNATRENVAIMIANALDVKLVRGIKVGGYTRYEPIDATLRMISDFDFDVFDYIDLEKYLPYMITTSNFSYISINKKIYDKAIELEECNVYEYDGELYIEFDDWDLASLVCMCTNKVKILENDNPFLDGTVSLRSKMSSAGMGWAGPANIIEDLGFKVSSEKKYLNISEYTTLYTYLKRNTVLTTPIEDDGLVEQDGVQFVRNNKKWLVKISDFLEYFSINATVEAGKYEGKDCLFIEY